MQLPQADHIHDGGQRPGKGINPVDNPDLMHGLPQREKDRHPHRAPAQQHDDHRRHRFPQPAHHGGSRMAEPAQAVEEGAYHGAAGAVSDDFRIAVEQSDQPRRQEISNRSEHCQYPCRAQQPKPGAFKPEGNW